MRSAPHGKPGTFRSTPSWPTESDGATGPAPCCPPPLDVDALDECAAALAGTHDFTAFTPTDTYHQRFTRDVHRAEWVRTGDVLEFWIEADTFMRHMNRVLVRTMVEGAPADEIEDTARERDALARARLK